LPLPKVHAQDLVGSAAREEASACAAAAYARSATEDARFTAAVFIIVRTMCAEACAAEGIRITATRK
jgi:hypothetical protein